MDGKTLLGWAMRRILERHRPAADRSGTRRRPVRDPYAQSRHVDSDRHAAIIRALRRQAQLTTDTLDAIDADGIDLAGRASLDGSEEVDPHGPWPWGDSLSSDPGRHAAIMRALRRQVDELDPHHAR